MSLMFHDDCLHWLDEQPEASVPSEGETQATDSYQSVLSGDC